MDEDAGLGEGGLDEVVERIVEHSPLRPGGPAAEMRREKPLREQLELRGQPRLIVGRHRVRRHAGLDPDQRGQRIPVQTGCARGVEPVEIRDRTEVFEQQETPLQVRGVDLRHVQPGRPHEIRDVHEGLRVFLVRGGVHHHERFAVRTKAEVAAKARIAGEGLEATAGPGFLVEPVGEAKRPARSSSMLPAGHRHPRPARADRHLHGPGQSFPIVPAALRRDRLQPDEQERPPPARIRSDPHGDSTHSAGSCPESTTTSPAPARSSSNARAG